MASTNAIFNAVDDLSTRVSALNDNFDGLFDLDDVETELNIIAERAEQLRGVVAELHKSLSTV